MNKHYKRGTYLSKGGIYESYDSGLEHQHMLALDAKGLHWTKNHGIRISYWNPSLRRMATYKPDFLLRTKDGYVLQEMKPYRLTGLPVNQAKFTAAREWCGLNGYIFEVVTFPGQVYKAAG
jgi:hypothetical protein